MSHITIIRQFRHAANGIHVVDIPPGDYAVSGNRDAPERGEISQLAGDTALQEGWGVPLDLQARPSKDAGLPSPESGAVKPLSLSQEVQAPAKKTRAKSKAKRK